MAKSNHIHRLKRHTYKSGNQIYFCVLDCKYKISPALAVGKKSICNRCGQEFVLTEYSVRLARPHCDACHKPKELKLSLEDKAREDMISKMSPMIQAAPEQPAVISLRNRLTALRTKNQTDEDEI